MKENIITVMHLPLPKRLAILIGTLGAILFGFYYFVLTDQWLANEELATQIETLELDVSKKKGIVANLPRYQEEVRRLDSELNKALRELPDQKSIENLLTQISDKARNAGLDINLFQPSPERRREFYAEIPVKLRVIGTFHQLASFFNEVGDLDRIVNLTEYQIKLLELSRKEIRLESEITATSFRFLDDSEREAAEEAQNKKRGRR
jgi:type IV pilus assembly protein PilO